jgi:hypothetical protein
MAKSEADQKKARKIVAWMILSELAVGAGISIWARIQHDWRYTVIGLGVISQALLILWLLSKSWAAKDPALAKKMEQARARSRRNARVEFISLGVALTVIIGALLVRRYLPGFAALPKGDQRLYLMLGGVSVIVLGNLAWMAWKRRNAARRVADG